MLPRVDERVAESGAITKVKSSETEGKKVVKIQMKEKMQEEKSRMIPRLSD